MARLSDVPKVLKSVGTLTFLRRVWGQASDDGLFTQASALAYSWMFAAFPFFIFLMTLVPYLPERLKGVAEHEITMLVYTALPKATADPIWVDFKYNVLDPPKGGLIFRVTGIVLALWAASGGMSMTMSALDRCYELPLASSRPFWKHRLVALGMTVVIAALILSVVILLPVGTAVRAWVVSFGHIDEGNVLLTLFDVVRWALSLLLLTSVLMVLYHFGPNIKHHFRWITPGAVFSVVVWILLGLAFRYYLTNYGGNYSKTYGALAGAVILLLVFYVDGVVLLMGAEINSEIDFEVLKVKRGTRDFMGAEDEPQQGLFEEPVEPAS